MAVFNTKSSIILTMAIWQLLSFKTNTDQENEDTITILSVVSLQILQLNYDYY